MPPCAMLDGATAWAKPGAGGVIVKSSLAALATNKPLSRRSLVVDVNVAPAISGTLTVAVNVQLSPAAKVPPESNKVDPPDTADPAPQTPVVDP